MRNEAAPDVLPPPDASQLRAAGDHSAIRGERRMPRPVEPEGLLARLGGWVPGIRGHSTTWLREAFAERRLGPHLDRSVGDIAVVLHDRHTIGSSGSIDHIVVAATGVWVISTRHIRGRVEKRRCIHRLDEVDLAVDGRDVTKYAMGLGWQVAELQACTSTIGYDWVDVHPTVCFTNAEWGRFTKPFQCHGAWITWPRSLTHHIASPGPLAPHDIAAVAAAIDARLPATPLTT